jgi:hypothetical protein
MESRIDFGRYVLRRALGVETLVIWAILAVLLHRPILPREADAAESLPVHLAVNAGTETYDSQPSLVIARDGGAWTAWHGYQRGRDRVLVRRLGPEESGPVEPASEEGTIHDGPVVVASGKEDARVVWAAKLDGRWQILARRIVRDAWQPVETLSLPEEDAIWPSAEEWEDGSLVVSWCGCRDGRFRIVCRTLENGAWRPAVAVSSAQCDAFRSAIAVDGQARAWVFWDCYENGRYAVWGRPVMPNLGEAERVSPEEANCLQPVALGAASGLYVAWLETVDVIGGRGAVSQRHTLHAACRADDGWQLIRSPDGESTAAELTHGLMARFEPELVPTGGYLGRRRSPMLLEDGSSVWLLWERKSDHRGRSPNVTGQLIGRKAERGEWGPPVILHQGLVDYHLAHPQRAVGGEFVLVASELPRKWRRVYHRIVGDLNDSTPLGEQIPDGWRPVKLPFDDDQGPRHEIRDGDKTYRLYWGDLHCHSGLTADAEGQPDELLHYARDRARLDVVVTENDAIYDCYLTEAEFALNHLLANRFSRDGTFLALPGFEWTSRVPNSPEADIADPRNWDSQRWSGTHPNHRTVIYPPSGGPVVRHPEVANDVDRLNRTVAQWGGVTFTQHETWDLTGHPVECGVEVTSGWGHYIINPALLHKTLDQGHRVGLVANGDSHRRAPGLSGALTGIYAESLAPDAIFDAFRNRRVFATAGSRIVVESRANGTLMGQETHVAEGQRVEIALSVIGTQPVESATLIRDGREIETYQGDGTRRLSVTYPDDGLSPGTHWYYWRIAQEGPSPDYPGNVMVARGPRAWSTPHWVSVEPRQSLSDDSTESTSAQGEVGWQAGPPILLPGAVGTFDQTAVKDPSVVFYDGKWHLFYTARGASQYTTGYVAAARLEDLQRAPRHQLQQLRGKTDGYGCAPQVFYLQPQKTWYLIFQTRDANYQPVYSTTATIEEPGSWTSPVPLVAKNDETKWIDFWVICDEQTAYLFFTRGHHDVYAATTPLDRFPTGWDSPRRVFGPVHEAVHVYRVLGRPEYHMLYETRLPGSDTLRRFGLATAPELLGPWTKLTDEFATGGQLVYPDGIEPWTEEVSHGELIRAGCDQRLEYDPAGAAFLIQGLRVDEHQGPYPDLPWRLGLIRQAPPP